MNLAADPAGEHLEDPPRQVGFGAERALDGLPRQRDAP
jgi:hypothetical protein